MSTKNYQEAGSSCVQEIAATQKLQDEAITRANSLFYEIVSLLERSQASQSQEEAAGPNLLTNLSQQHLESRRARSFH